ncbi:MAG: MarR family transcriptional regulator [Clostridium sp.]|nr:MarR family transcriptional regulator [Clostridium sp.]
MRILICNINRSNILVSRLNKRRKIYLEKEQSLQKLFLQVARLHFLRSHSLIEKTEVHHGQGSLLVALHFSNGQTQKKLADSMGIKPATLNVMIKRMEKTGLVKKEQDKKDQRTTRIFITEKGEEEYHKVRLIWEQIEEEMFKNLTVEEKIILRRVLLQIQDNFLELMPDAKLFCHIKGKN